MTAGLDGLPWIGFHSAAADASVHDHFNQDRRLNRREVFKQTRAAALAEWRQLAA